MIENKYKMKEPLLGMLLTTELEGANDGLYKEYNGGNIYWHPFVGAFEVHGDILQKYKLLGAEAGFLGYPTTDELITPDGFGRFNHFQNGSIYWTPDTGAHEVHGARFCQGQHPR